MSRQAAASAAAGACTAAGQAEVAGEQPDGRGDQAAAAVTTAPGASPVGKVTFDIEPAGQQVKLTVVHDGFDPGSVVLASVSTGWPQVLSALKTLLETGAPVPA